MTLLLSIADQYAANGYFTVVPDLFNGNVVPLNPPADFDLMKWVQTQLPQVPQVDSIIEGVIKGLRGELGVKRLGGVGKRRRSPHIHPERIANGFATFKATASEASTFADG